MKSHITRKKMATTIIIISLIILNSKTFIIIVIIIQMEKKSKSNLHAQIQHTHIHIYRDNNPAWNYLYSWKFNYNSLGERKKNHRNHIDDYWCTKSSQNNGFEYRINFFPFFFLLHSIIVYETNIMNVRLLNDCYFTNWYNIYDLVLFNFFSDHHSSSRDIIKNDEQIWSPSSSLCICIETMCNKRADWSIDYV